MIIPSTGEVAQPMAEDLTSNLEQNQSQPKEEDSDKVKDKKRWQEFRQRIDLTKMYRKKLIRNWIVNVDYRRGKTFMSQPDDDTVAVNLDWSLTKTKEAALFSQIPQVHLSHAPQTLSASWMPAYERTLNDNLRKCGLEAAMREVMPDCINAAGVGIILVSHETLTRTKQIPSVDISILPPEMQQEALEKGTVQGHKIPTQAVPQVMDSRYVIKRISPADFLWPIDFTGSDFDNAPWIGYTGRIPWEEAKFKFNLKDEDKDKVLVDQRTVEDLLAHEYDREHLGRDNLVGFDEIFYTAFQYDDDAPNFGAIHRLVYLHGKVDPVIDEPWNGQQIDPKTNEILGSTKRPVRVLTLTYITDEDIPPSDSAIGRAQVNELNKGRTHMNKQRARTAPWTWFDVNRLDPTIQGALMRGVWQHAIPVQGDGARVIGTVQQPPMQQENFAFDRIAKQDLQELWTIGSNQTGTGEGVDTKGEADVIQSNFSTKVTMERAQVASFVAGIAEVLGAMMALYEDPKTFGEGFDPKISQHLGCTIMPDATIILDSNQKLKKLNDFLNVYAKSGWVNIEPILRDIATLVGLDPSTVIVKPQPNEPDAPNISVRMTGSQDLMNPLMLAFLLKTGQAPDEKAIEQAKELIQHAVIPPAAPPGQPTGPLPPGAPTPTGEANPQMSTLPPITQRSDNPSQPPAGAQ